ncbi:MAG: hypothetical protein DWQ01_20165 [Planctomycetota bacterium]|nr:MAG: hypothetical protein DWQ01_20165 [Planctomycetota bacterium]
MLKVDRRTLAARLWRMGEHAREFHRQRCREASALLKSGGVFQLDELETYETDRRLQPLTVSVLIHRYRYFVIHAAVGTLPCRGSLAPHLRKKKVEREKVFGKRRSESRKIVTETFQALKDLLSKDDCPVVQSDGKKTYPRIMKSVFGQHGFEHRVEPSKGPRNRNHPLFPINHTLAQMRDNISRLVRRNWGVSKRRQWLVPHLWLWILWRNYLRPIVAEGNPPTPGELVGASTGRLTAEDVFRWRIFSSRDLQ